MIITVRGNGRNFGDDRGDTQLKEELSATSIRMNYKIDYRLTELAFLTNKSCCGAMFTLFSIM